MKRNMGEKILNACQKENIGTMLMKVNPVGSYLAYKANLDKAKREGKPTKRLEAFVARFKKRADQAQGFINKNRLTTNEEITRAAYRFALNHPHADTALFNFTTFEQIDTLLGASGTGLSKKDKQTISLVNRGYDSLYCRHACNACEGSCPHQVPVNTIMRYNYYFQAKGEEKYAMGKYAELTGANAANCHNCSGDCVKACPYGVAIQELLTAAHLNLSL
jgi:predicted aldo/keto reductase-like oxidoreductase